MQTSNHADQSVRSFRGKSPRLGRQVMVDPTAVVIGDASLGDDCSVWPMAVIRADMHSIKLGDRCSVQDGAVLHITHSSTFNPGGFPLIIGDDVTIGHQAMLHGCQLGNRILVGMKAMIMDGARIEDDCIIAAGAVVTPGKSLKGGYLYKGTPAKAVRPITDDERRMLPYVAGNYVSLKNEYLTDD